MLKKWLRRAIDSTRAVHMPYPDVVSELAAFAPSEPQTLYRGLLFRSEAGFYDFLKANSWNGKTLTLKGRSDDVSSWAHSKDTAYSFATCAPSSNSFQGTLQWLHAQGRIQGEYGVVLQGTVRPEDVLVDLTKVPDSVGTKTYVGVDEVFVKPTAEVVCTVVYAADKSGDIEAVEDRFGQVLAKDIIGDLAAKRIAEKTKWPMAYSLLGPNYSNLGHGDLNYKSSDKDIKIFVARIGLLTGQNLENMKVSDIRKLLKTKPSAFQVSVEQLRHIVHVANVKQVAVAASYGEDLVDRAFGDYVSSFATDEQKQREKDVLQRVRELLPKDWVETQLERIVQAWFKIYGPQSASMKIFLERVAPRQT